MNCKLCGYTREYDKYVTPAPMCIFCYRWYKEQWAREEGLSEEEIQKLLNDIGNLGSEISKLI